MDQAGQRIGHDHPRSQLAAGMQMSILAGRWEVAAAPAGIARNAKKQECEKGGMTLRDQISAASTSSAACRTASRARQHAWRTLSAACARARVRPHRTVDRIAGPNCRTALHRGRGWGISRLCDPRLCDHRNVPGSTGQAEPAAERRSPIIVGGESSDRPGRRHGVAGSARRIGKKIWPKLFEANPGASGGKQR